MRMSMCDHCGAGIEIAHLLQDEDDGHLLPKDLEVAVTLKIPMRTECGFKWRDMDFCASCAKKIPFCRLQIESKGSAEPAPETLHECLPGQGQEAWHDTFPTPAIVERTRDGTWYCGGGDGDFGVNAAYCPFCGVKLGELAPVEKDGGER